MSNVRIIAVALLIVVLALAYYPARASEGPRELQAVDGCGDALPAYFLNPGDVPGMFGAQPDQMVRLFAHSYATDIAKSCRARPELQQMLRNRVAAICFAAAAGVDEPHPYIVGKWLVIEVHPDAYARVTFRRKLAAAIERGSLGAPSYDCAPGAG